MQGEAGTEPEMVMVPLADLKDALADLSGYIAQECQCRDIYPSQRRKYARDMAVVTRLQDAIALTQK